MAEIIPFTGFRLKPDTPEKILTALFAGAGAPSDGDRPGKEVPSAAYLHKDPEPCFYGYRVDYQTIGGLEKNRLGFIGRLNPFHIEKPDVIPVVDSPAALTEQSLVQMKASGYKQGLLTTVYEDPQFDVERLLTQGMVQSAQEVSIGGQRHVLWPISNTMVIKALKAFFESRFCFPVDGLQYFRAARRYYHERQDAGEAVDPETCFPMALFLNIYDFGVHLEASQYLVPRMPDFQINQFVLQCHDTFDIKNYPWENKTEKALVFEEFKEDLRLHGTTDVAVGACFAGEPQFFLFTLKPGMAGKASLPADVPVPYHPFSAIYLQKLFIEKYCWQDRLPEDGDGGVRIVAGMDEALAQVSEGHWGAAFFLPPPNKRNLLKLAQKRLRLPYGAIHVHPPCPVGLVSDQIISASLNH